MSSCKTEDRLLNWNTGDFAFWISASFSSLHLNVLSEFVHCEASLVLSRVKHFVFCKS